MQFTMKHIALAGMLAAATSAHAIEPGQPVDFVINISGASGMRGLVASYVFGECDATLTGATDKIDVLWNNNTGTNVTAWNSDPKAGERIRAISCTIKAGSPLGAGKKVLMQKSDGGSSQGVVPVAGTVALPGGTAIANGFLTISAADCTATGSTPTPDTPSYVCKTANSTTVPDAGFSDLEPNVFTKAPNLGTALTADQRARIDPNTKQVILNLFGLAVSKDLYLALQKTQFPSAPFPLDLANVDNNPRPSLPRTFVSSVLSGLMNAPGSGNGWQPVVSASVDPALATRQVNVCRRANGSGTQAGANAFFLDNFCSVGKLPLATATGTIGSTGTFAVQSNASASLVEDCLGISRGAGGVPTTRDGTGYYAIGHLTRENSPFDSAGLATNPIADEGWRYVAIDGQEPTTAAAQDGKYAYAFESTMQWNSVRFGTLSVDQQTFLNGFVGNVGKAAVLATQVADIKAGFLATAGSTAANFFQDYDATEKIYTARVSRGGNSCSMPTILK